MGANRRAYHAMIAATAIANDLPLYTCSPVDFAGIDDLQIVVGPLPPPRPDRRRRARPR